MSSRALSVGVPNLGGDLVAQDFLASEFIETLNSTAQVMRLGARQLTGLVGNVVIPRMTVGSTVSWINEGQDYGLTNPTFDQLTLTPHDCSARTQISRRLLIQSTPAIDELVRADLSLRIALAIDAAAIGGSGTAGVPLGILSTPGIGIVGLGTNGAAPSWDGVTELIEAVAAANGLRGSLGWLINGAVMGTLMRTPLVAGFPRFVWEAGAVGGAPDEGSIAGFKAYVSNNIPNSLTKGTSTGDLSALIFGNWNDLLIGSWRGLDVVVDPYSGSATGTLNITAISTIDIAVRHAQSFAAITDAVTT